MTEEKDMVNHPFHYQNSCSLECIEVMRIIFGDERVRHNCLVTAFKYMWRYKNKNGDEDIRKARWYLNYADKLISLAISEQKPALEENNSLDEDLKLWHRLDEYLRKIEEN